MPRLSNWPPESPRFLHISIAELVSKVVGLLLYHRRFDFFYAPHILTRKWASIIVLAERVVAKSLGSGEGVPPPIC